MNVLVLAAHPDDEALGCGGAALTHGAAGDAVRVAFLTSGELGLGTYPVGEAQAIREEEARRAAAVLGLAPVDFVRLADGSLADDTASLASEIAGRLDGVDLVYAPHPGEHHADHAAVGQAVADLAPVQARWYEIWTPIGDPDCVIDISEHMPRKLEAIRCYKSQLEYWPYDRAIEGLNAYRGAMLGGVTFAEVFTARR